MKSIETFCEENIHIICIISNNSLRAVGRKANYCLCLELIYKSHIQLSGATKYIPNKNTSIASKPHISNRYVRPMLYADLSLKIKTHYPWIIFGPTLYLSDKTSIIHTHTCFWPDKHLKQMYCVACTTKTTHHMSRDVTELRDSSLGIIGKKILHKAIANSLFYIYDFIKVVPDLSLCMNKIQVHKTNNMDG